MREINSISEYIAEINCILDERKNDGDRIVVYRGEPRKYPVPGKPGIYRDTFLKKEPFFEKNLLNEMKVNRITEGNTYLERAVDAQHDEFPSRLLDVTYNALIALYFAVTPYYKKYEEDAYDKLYDGVVIIYFLPHMYCAGADNIETVFNDTIDRKHPYLSHPLVQENYKLVDHIKMNTRICVQQGAFILFQGDGYTPISPKDYEVITIKKSCRKKIREDLSILFGINTGFVYPEPYNLNATIGDKAYRIKNNIIDINSEVMLFLKKIEGEIEYYFIKCIKISSNYSISKEERKKQIVEFVMKLEVQLMNYKTELEDYLDNFGEELTEDYGLEFNRLIEEYDTDFMVFETDYGITRSTKPTKYAKSLFVDLAKGELVNEK